MAITHLPGGGNIFYREAGSGPVVVLLHGWSMSSAVFQEVMSGLAENFHVLAPDLPGHGESSLNKTDFDHSDLAADLECWLRELGIKTISLLGWSLGGQVALTMSLRRQVCITKLVLVATTPLFVRNGDWAHGLPATQVRAMDRQMQRHFTQSMSEFFRLMFADEGVSPERYREIIRFAVRDGSLPPREVARRGLKILGACDLRPQLGALNLPVLVHYGGLDLITDPAAGHYLAEAIPEACEFHWEKVGHAPFLSHPENSVELWSGFLS
ncbi:MAG: O-methylpimelyl-ACP methylesterase [Desulfuromonas sp.]|nr:MAG: O-methylpimelyl-ACP methylesterase [Desulfuromonas sp.]